MKFPISLTPPFLLLALSAAIHVQGQLFCHDQVKHIVTQATNCPQGQESIPGSEVFCVDQKSRKSVGTQGNKCPDGSSMASLQDFTSDNPPIKIGDTVQLILYCRDDQTGLVTPAPDTCPEGSTDTPFNTLACRTFNDGSLIGLDETTDYCPDGSDFVALQDYTCPSTQCKVGDKMTPKNGIVPPSDNTETEGDQTASANDDSSEADTSNSMVGGGAGYNDLFNFLVPSYDYYGAIASYGPYFCEDSKTHEITRMSFTEGCNETQQSIQGFQVACMDEQRLNVVAPVDLACPKGAKMINMARWKCPFPSILQDGTCDPKAKLLPLNVSVAGTDAFCTNSKGILSISANSFTCPPSNYLTDSFYRPSCMDSKTNLPIERKDVLCPAGSESIDAAFFVCRDATNDVQPTVKCKGKVPLSPADAQNRINGIQVDIYMYAHSLKDAEKDMAAGGNGTATQGDGTATGDDGAATGGNGTATGGDGASTGGDGASTGGDGASTGDEAPANGGEAPANGGEAPANGSS
ncbi:MAG: hypothetical protein DHS80DRAFT_31781 [Piptocephalis tieghemiana]|nr:MAG: hypothetical protein DHS80DRAFT_31781 [Piptocephalis tieghemiana]